MTFGHPRQDHPCPAWYARLEAFVDGELPREEADAVGAHLRRCPACLAEVQALAEMSQGLRAAASERAPAALWSRIDAAIGTSHTGELQVGNGRWWMSRRTAITGAAGIACLAAAVAWRSLPGPTSVVTASVNDFITYRARGWTVDHAARDPRRLAEWAQARVTFAVPELKPQVGAFTVDGVRLCWLLERRLLGVTYASGEDRAVVYLMEARGLALPAADRTLPGGTRASVHHVKGHGVAVWTEKDLLFVLVAAGKDFPRVLQGGGQRADARERPARAAGNDTS